MTGIPAATKRAGPGASSLRDFRYIVERLGNVLVSCLAGLASFIFTLTAFLILTDLNQQIAASVVIGLFALLIVWVASENPNSGHARASKALIERLLAVRSGDLGSPAPEAVRREMPELASAVDALFEQVRSTIDKANAIAMYDPVTSLPNRVYFRREAERVLQARPGEGRVGLLFIDLDGFKDVNDRLGHADGDEVLALVADRLREALKAAPSGHGEPLLARLAGDEFTMLLPSLPSAADAERVAQAALAGLTQPLEHQGRVVRIGACIGVAVCPLHGTELNALMKAADIAMYHAKFSGRSQVCLYHPALADAFDRRASAGAGVQLRAERITRA
jgi:diguanylate cyclase (GGDEF)-like protein